MSCQQNHVVSTINKIGGAVVYDNVPYNPEKSLSINDPQTLFNSVSKMFDEGITSFTLIQKDGSEKKIRLFKSSSGFLCYFKKNAKNADMF